MVHGIFATVDMDSGECSTDGGWTPADGEAEHLGSERAGRIVAAGVVQVPDAGQVPGLEALRDRQIRAAVHGASVMKCWKA